VDSALGDLSSEGDDDEEEVEVNVSMEVEDTQMEGEAAGGDQQAEKERVLQLQPDMLQLESLFQHQQRPLMEACYLCPSLFHPIGLARWFQQSLHSPCVPCSVRAPGLDGGCQKMLLLLLARGGPPLQNGASVRFLTTGPFPAFQMHQFLSP